MGCEASKVQDGHSRGEKMTASNGSSPSQAHETTAPSASMNQDDGQQGDAVPSALAGDDVTLPTFPPVGQ
jgi:hypothetical protein